LQKYDFGVAAKRNGLSRRIFWPSVVIKLSEMARCTRYRPLGTSAAHSLETLVIPRNRGSGA
jgi:hypothetical protein